MAKVLSPTKLDEWAEPLAHRRTKNVRLTAAALVCFVFAVFAFSIYHIALEQRASGPSAAALGQ